MLDRLRSAQVGSGGQKFGQKFPAFVETLATRATMRPPGLPTLPLHPLRGGGDLELFCYRATISSRALPDARNRE